jgi:hypothetical protein
MMMYVGAGILLLVAASGFAVVRTSQILALGLQARDRTDVLFLPGARRRSLSNNCRCCCASTDGDVGYLSRNNRSTFERRR